MRTLPDILSAVILLNSAATFFLTGVIWTIQTVHYPLLAAISKSEFSTHHRFHTKAIAPVVGPVMILELITSAYLSIALFGSAQFEIALAGLILVIAIWLSTFLVQVRQHNRLARGFDARAHRILVRTNWIRTAAWSFRSLLAIWLLSAVLSDRL